MYLNEYLDVRLLEDHLKNDLVRSQKHPVLPLVIYNYTERTQFTSAWDDVTRKCRALIADNHTGKVVARGYEKFFNYAEHSNGKAYAPALPAESFVAYEKVDGSLILIFYAYGAWHVASRGSFTSEQAEKARELLYEESDWLYATLDPDYTYVTEIVYPENRIVVDYGDTTELVLHGVFNNKTLEEVPLWYMSTANWEALPFARVVKTYPFDGGVFLLDHLASGSNDKDGNFVRGTEAEGFVVRFESGVRCKIKYNDYVHMHKIITNCTAKSVWETLSTGGTISDLFEGTPDEFKDWLEKTVEDLYGQYNKFIGEAYNLHQVARASIGLTRDRKKFAEVVLRDVPKMYQSAMFNLFDNKSIVDIAWKSCKPEGSSPFKKES